MKIKTKNNKSGKWVIKGYKEINLRAMRILNEGGILVSCSCSHYFDENTFLYDEELIIGIRMQLANKQTWYNGKAIVEHHHGYTTQKNSAFMQKCIRESEQYYCREYLQANKIILYILFGYRKILQNIRIWFKEN